MVEVNQAIREDLLSKLEKQHQERQRVEQERQKLEEQLSIINTGIEALEQVLLRFYPNGNAPLEKAETPWTVAKEFRDMTQPEILKALAERKGGLVNYSDATQFLLQNGLSKAKRKNLGSHIYTLLRDSPEWERVSPGTFRLLEKGNQAKLTLG